MTNGTHQRYSTSHHSGQFSADGKPQSSASMLLGHQGIHLMKFFKYAFLLIGGDSRPGVGDGNGECLRIGHFDGDADGAVGRRKFNTVGEEIEQNLLQTSCIRRHHGNISIDGKAHVQIFFIAQRLHKINTEKESTFSLVALGSGLLALATMVVIALLIEYLTMRSLAPGQLIFSLVISFYLAGFAAGLIFKKAPDVFYIASPMVTAGISYLLASHIAGPYPGYPGFRPAYALPIYYASAGVAGVLMGYYSAMRAVHHGVLDGAHQPEQKAT